MYIYTCLCTYIKCDFAHFIDNRIIYMHNSFSLTIYQCDRVHKINE